MNTTTSRVASNRNLDRVGQLNNLDQLINGNPSQWGVVSEVTMTATFEAILGAVYLDSGNTTTEVRRVMQVLGLWPEQEQ